MFPNENQNNELNPNSLKIQYDGKTLIAEWDNRRIPRSGFATWFLLCFWLIWTPSTIFVTYLVVSGRGPTTFLCAWLVFGYLGVVVVPLIWLLRHAIERIEIGNQSYRHFYVNLPWFFPKRWAVDDITQIDFGYCNEESIATLNVRKGWNRDMVAYWARTEFKKLLFDKIRNHLEEIESGISVVEYTKNGILVDRP